VFCEVAVTVVGWLGGESLSEGLRLSAVTKVWCIAREGLSVVLFMGARA